jgi:hypothetical protein
MAEVFLPLFALGIGGAPPQQAKDPTHFPLTGRTSEGIFFRVLPIAARKWRNLSHFLHFLRNATQREARTRHSTITQHTEIPDAVATTLHTKVFHKSRRYIEQQPGTLKSCKEVWPQTHDFSLALGP